jgi:F-box protein 25/32
MDYRYFGMREVYADMIHICCHCKALFWKDHGHPCVSRDAPSVRVTPQQFVDMLLFL